jgi:integrase/recombinase XerD
MFLGTVRVSELINIRIEDVDFERCQIRINSGKGGKDRIVPYPVSFKEVLAMHVDKMMGKRANYLFESNRQRKYTDRGIRKILAKYAKKAGLDHSISPHQLRHFLLTWLKKQGIDDALIQPYSGHSSRQSLEIYSRFNFFQSFLQQSCAGEALFNSRKILLNNLDPRGLVYSLFASADVKLAQKIIK